MKKNLLLIFAEKIFAENNINIAQLDEQFQIAFQILINKGYKVLVSGDGDQSFEFAKRFSYLFQDENMKNTEIKLSESQKIDLIKNNDCIICFHEELIELINSLHKTFILINVKAKNVAEKDDIEEKNDEFTIDNLNAGEIVKKIENLLVSEVNIDKEKDIDVENEKSGFIQNSSDEFEEYKNQIKKTIEQFINNNQLEEAQNLISEYESIVKDDLNIYSMKSVIAIMENRLDDAESLLLHGYKIDKNNFDILYNLAYLYYICNNIDLSVTYYKKAILHTSDKNIQEEVYKILKDMGEKDSLENILRNVNKNGTSIIILTYNNLEYNKLCIDSIRKYTEPGTYEIVVVDNNSSDGTRDWLKSQKDIKVILNNENVGFPKGCNIGIEAASSENDILLLNNDTIVTPNWLYNLKKCLYDDELNGAVGAVTNSCSYYQAIPVEYKNVDEMIKFAEKFNISNRNKWEQRVKLVGFCMLVKRSVANKIGLLDIRFSPGNFEDDDYSYRIQEAGYRLYLCNDTFIHHFGSTSFNKDRQAYNNLLAINAEKFREKWGFNSSDACSIRNDIIEKIDNDKADKINILEIGCACGATLIKIKELYKNANTYGIELDENLSKITSRFIDINKENLEDLKLNYENNFFDYIIFSDTLEKMYDPWKVLNGIKKYLKPNGKLLLSIHNIMHYTVLNSLLNGQFNYGGSEILNKKHIRFFTLNETVKLLEESKYTNIECSGTILNGNEEYEKFIESVGQLANESNKQQYSVYKYIVKATKLDNYIYIDNTKDERELIENNEINKEYTHNNSKNEQPLLTIGIPTYNRAHKLDICLDSIFSQIGDNEEIEVLVINNDSPDNTEEIVRKYESYKNLTYIRNDENIGGDKNILKVAEESKGKFLFWHGDDDIFKENTIMTILNIIKQNRECGLFFVDVLKKNQNIYKGKGLKRYLENVSFSGTFMSSIIINKYEYYKIEDRSKFLKKAFNQVYIQYMILKLNPNFCIIYNPVFYYLGNIDFPLKYKWAEIFIKNYIDTINYFLDNGLDKKSISEEKLRIMNTTILPRYKLALEKKVLLNLEDFEEIVIEYYKNENYFNELYDVIKRIQEEIKHKIQ